MDDTLRKLVSEVRQAMRAARDDDAAELVAEILSDYANPMCLDPRHFAKDVTGRVHRTLQQTMFKLFVQCIAQWGERYNKGQYDPRNKFACEVSAKLLPVLEETFAVQHGKAHAPLI